MYIYFMFVGNRGTV